MRKGVQQQRPGPIAATDDRNKLMIQRTIYLSFHVSHSFVSAGFSESVASAAIIGFLYPKINLIRKINTGSLYGGEHSRQSRNQLPLLDLYNPTSFLNDLFSIARSR